ncbi:MAG: prepilin peptidase [Pirellulaceae bacterium]|nr:prepilin peptidase [Pirellulaceae bacterium]
MQWLTGLWFLTFGASIGSFLNVVAYRLPRGLSLVFQPSQCPSCKSHIRARDNIPVLGWLLLGGRCRDCRMAISPRYPLVEGLTAGIFFVLFLFQLTSGGANIPFYDVPLRTGIEWIIFAPHWQLIALYGFHCLLVSCLLALILMDVDGQRAGWLALCIMALLLIVPPALDPSLTPIPISFPLSDSSESGGQPPEWQGALAVSLIGGGIGAAVGVLLAVTAGQTGQLTMALVLVGLGLGWQAVIAITLLTCAMRALLLPLGRQHLRRIPWTACLILAFMIHHLLWRRLVEYW